MTTLNLTPAECIVFEDLNDDSMRILDIYRARAIETARVVGGECDVYAGFTCICHVDQTMVGVLTV